MAFYKTAHAEAGSKNAKLLGHDTEDTFYVEVRKTPDSVFEIASEGFATRDEAQHEAYRLIA